MIINHCKSAVLMLKAGYYWVSSCQVVSALLSLTIWLYRWVIGILIWESVYISLRVTVSYSGWSFWIVLLSIVIAKGIPSSSVRAYLFPIVAFPSSTLQDTPLRVRFFFISSRTSLNWLLDTTESKLHFTGAILGGNNRYVLFWSLNLKLCSNTQYTNLPIPKEGSITWGTNFSSWTVTKFFLNYNIKSSSSNY